MSRVRNRIRKFQPLPSPLSAQQNGGSASLIGGVGEGRDGGISWTLHPHLDPPPSRERSFCSFCKGSVLIKVYARLFLFFFLLSTPSAFACPLCKEAIAKMGEIWTALGFNWSIYFMISIPFLLVAAFGGALYLNYRKQHRR